MFQLPKRFQSLVPAGTVAFLAAAAERRAKGEDIISLAAAEPHTRTADAVNQAAIELIAARGTQFAGAEGTPALKQALARKLQDQDGLDYAPGQIIVANGTKPLMTSVFLALLEPGDEVVVPSPYYNAYTEIVRLAGGVPVSPRCGIEQGFLLEPAQLAAAISPRTRALFLSNPNNPAGARYSAAHWEAIAAVLAHHPDVWSVVDEIFEHLAFDAIPPATPATQPGLRERTIRINGFSKGYSMNGWRLGYAAGPLEAIRAIADIAAHIGGPPSPISQAAGVAALTHGGQATRAELAELRLRRDRTVDALNTLAGLRCHVPQATFLAFPDCSGTFGLRSPDGTVIRNDEDYALALLAHAGVAVAPGSGFGFPGHIRLSFAPPAAIVDQALERLAHFHASLS